MYSENAMRKDKAELVRIASRMSKGEMRRAVLSLIRKASAYPASLLEIVIEGLDEGHVVPKPQSNLPPKKKAEDLLDQITWACEEIISSSDLELQGFSDMKTKTMSVSKVEARDSFVEARVDVDLTYPPKMVFEFEATIDAVQIADYLRKSGDYKVPATLPSDHFLKNPQFWKLFSKSDLSRGDEPSNMPRGFDLDEEILGDIDFSGFDDGFGHESEDYQLNFTFDSAPNDWGITSLKPQRMGLDVKGYVNFKITPYDFTPKFDGYSDEFRVEPE
jgi:hypothetical protein